jgi:hypothetical protein
MAVWAEAAVPVILGVNGWRDRGEGMAEQEELDRAEWSHHSTSFLQYCGIKRYARLGFRAVMQTWTMHNEQGFWSGAFGGFLFSPAGIDCIARRRVNVDVGNTRLLVCFLFALFLLLILYPISFKWAWENTHTSRQSLHDCSPVHHLDLFFGTSPRRKPSAQCCSALLYPQVGFYPSLKVI